VNKSRRNYNRLVKFAAVMVCGSAMTGACSSRVRDAVVGGIREVLLSQELAAAIVEGIVGADESGG